MTWKTHLAGGLQAGLLFTAVTGHTGTLAFTEIGIAMLGSVLPDIDHPSSKISRTDLGLRLVSSGISKVTKHRRGTHTIWCSALFAAILLLLFYLIPTAQTPVLLAIAIGIVADLAHIRIGTFLGIAALFILPMFPDIPMLTISRDNALLYAAALFAGCISHLIYDTFNPQGIMWLHPVSKKRFSIANIQTESKSERYFCFLMTLIAFAMLIIIMPVPSIGTMKFL